MSGDTYKSKFMSRMTESEKKKYLLDLLKKKNEEIRYLRKKLCQLERAMK